MRNISAQLVQNLKNMYSLEASTVKVWRFSSSKDIDRQQAV